MYVGVYLCRAQWLKGSASNPRLSLREPGFQSCIAVLKPWARFFTRHCPSSMEQGRTYNRTINRGNSGSKYYFEPELPRLIVRSSGHCATCVYVCVCMCCTRMRAYMHACLHLHLRMSALNTFMA